MNNIFAPDVTTPPTSLLRASAWAGILGPILFTATFLVLEVVRAPEYDRIADTVSTLEAGPHGWVQQANFILFGLLTIVFAFGLHRAIAPSRGGFAGPLLLGVSGVANILAGVVPVRLDATGAAYAPIGHVVAGTAFFATSAIALVLLSPRLGKDSRWSGLARYSAAAGVVAIVGFVVMGALVVPDDAALHEYAGLGQRLLVLVVVFPCRVTMAARLLRLTPSPVGRGVDTEVA